MWILQVEDQNPWHASLGLNNDYSADTEKLRSVATLGYDNLWQLGHSISLTYFTAPQDTENAKVWSGSYSAPLNERWTLQFSGYQSDSNIATIGGSNVLGKGHSYGVSAIYSLPAAGNWANSFSFGVDFKDFDEQMKFGASSDQVPLKYAPFTLGYNGYRYTEQSQLGLGLNLVVGTRAFFGYGSDAEEFDYKRYKASASFAVLKGDLNYTYTFANDWQSASKGAFQLASGPLVSNEQYSAGGATSVRGYLAAERTGDEGYLLSQELRTPSLAKFLGSYVQEWRFYAFAEGARMRLHDPLPRAGRRIQPGQCRPGHPRQFEQVVVRQPGLGLPAARWTEHPETGLATALQCAGDFLTFSSGDFTHATPIPEPVDLPGLRAPGHCPCLVAGRLALPQTDFGGHHRPGRRDQPGPGPHRVAGAPAHRQLHL